MAGYTEAKSVTLCSLAGHIGADNTIVTFINTTNPYTEPESPRIPDGYSSYEVASQSSYMSYEHCEEGQNSHATGGLQSQGLEALSTAALYCPTTDATSRTSRDAAGTGHRNYLEASTRSKSGLAFPVSPSTSASASNCSPSFLVPTSETAIDPLIDPALETPHTAMHGL